MVVSRMIPVDSVNNWFRMKFGYFPKGSMSALDMWPRKTSFGICFNAVDIDKNQVISFMARN